MPLSLKRRTVREESTARAALARRERPVPQSRSRAVSGTAGPPACPLPWENSEVNKYDLFLRNSLMELGSSKFCYFRPANKTVGWEKRKRRGRGKKKEGRNWGKKRGREEGKERDHFFVFFQIHQRNENGFYHFHMQFSRFGTLWNIYLDIFASLPKY